MEHQNQAGQSALAYTIISLAAALIFLTAATFLGQYNMVARLGGTLWVFMLSVIVTMPLVTSHFKERARK